MKGYSFLLGAVLLVSGCSETYRLVYSNGFSFRNYDYIVVSKPDASSTATSLYGMDIEFANMMSRYNMNIIGDKEYAGISSAKQARTLVARLSLISTGSKANLISVSLDDAPSGKTVASITAKAKGDMFSQKDRTKALEAVSHALIRSLEQDKGLTVSDKEQS